MGCMQDEFEVARGLVLNREQVVEALAPLMTADRIARIDQARVSTCWAVT